MSLLRDKILSKHDVKEQLVHVDEWDVDILVKGLTGRQRASISESAVGKDGNPDLKKFHPDIIIACAHDPETGERVFEPADRDALLDKAGTALDAVVEVALRLSGLLSGQQEAVKSPSEG